MPISSIIAALRNRKTLPSLIVGISVFFAFTLTWVISVILDLGGGSLAKGWDSGSGYLGFYGIFMLPFAGFIGLVSFGISKLVGSGIVASVSTLGISWILIDSVITSSPGAKLQRIAGQSEIPELTFERYEQGQTFSDGTAYLWVAYCSAKEAEQLIEALALKRIPEKALMGYDGTFIDEREAIGTYKAVFEGDVASEELYFNGRGMIGGFSPNEKKFRLYWWPAALAN